MPVGSLIVGEMAAWLGEPPTVMIGGLIVFAYSIFIYMAVPKVRKLA
jgi:hypothetical protein